MTRVCDQSAATGAVSRRWRTTTRYAECVAARRRLEFPMKHGGVAARMCLAGVVACAALHAQALVAGRVVDETGAGVAGARIEIHEPGAAAVAASSDPAGNYSLTLPHEGEYDIRAERLGFFVYRGAAQRFAAGPNQLTIVLNHLQEYSERVDVTYSPPAIDPQQASDRKELDNAEIQAVPFPAPQDYRNGLQLMNGVVLDNAGRPHVNGADVQQTGYTLDGFNIADPVTGRLEARLNIDTIQTIELQTSRFSADNGRGAAGVLNLQTKMGDDRWRFAGTNFIPGVANDSGVRINKWTPRLELSGPLKRHRAWFHNGFDAFYSADVVHGLPPRQNLTRGITASDMTRFQVNLTSANILTGSFLVNATRDTRSGLSILNPVEATSTHHQTLFVSSVREQHYLNGALLDMGSRTPARFCATYHRATRSSRSRPSATAATTSSTPIVTPTGNRVSPTCSCLPTIGGGSTSLSLESISSARRFIR